MDKFLNKSGENLCFGSVIYFAKKENQSLSTRFQMSSSDTIDNIAYKPGSFRYQDLPTDQRKKLFEDRQKELNPCLKVRDFICLRDITE